MPTLLQDSFKALSKLIIVTKSLLGLRGAKFSLAQRLPSDILHGIIQYVVKEKRPLFNRVSSDKHCMRGMIAVCSLWRQAALAYLWRELVLNIDVDVNKVRIEHVIWHKNLKPTDVSSNSVRELYLKFSGARVTSGTAHKLLTKFIKEIGTFNQALKLCVILSDCMKVPVSTRDAALENIHKLAKLLMSMTPAATMSKVIWAGFDTHVERHNEELLGMFINSICTNAQGSMLNFDELNLRHPSTIDCISQLSSLKLRCGKSPTLHSALVHKCANVLQYLDIGIHDAKALIYDINGDPVIYPKMLYLQVYMDVLENLDEKSYVPDIVPFPALKSLQLQMGYPFGDNVMFRGNCTTLEVLDMHLSRESMAMLNDSQTFKGKYKKLKRVHVYETGPEYHPRNSDATLHKFICSIASSACKLELMCGRSDDCYIALTTYDVRYEYIQELTLWRDTLSLYKILRLLKTLPVLTRLCCNIGEVGAEFDHIPAKELPDHISFTYCDIGKHLHTISSPQANSSGISASSKFKKLLAITCPKLRFVY